MNWAVCLSARGRALTVDSPNLQSGIGHPDSRSVTASSAQRFASVGQFDRRERSAYVAGLASAVARVRRQQPDARTGHSTGTNTTGRPNAKSPAGLFTDLACNLSGLRALAATRRVQHRTESGEHQRIGLGFRHGIYRTHVLKLPADGSARVR